uniref:Uncharacterized protein n=1 Tax=Mesocestoides corti TaxID=53468 RepID=A0A5K3FYD7_MESCO
MACEEDMEPIRDRHVLEVACNERCSLPGGLGHTAHDAHFWLMISY